VLLTTKHLCQKKVTINLEDGLTLLGEQGDGLTIAEGWDGDCPVEGARMTSGDAAEMSSSGISTGGRRDGDCGVVAFTTGGTLFKRTGESSGVVTIEVWFEELEVLDLCGRR
jgi:hypothetical protein